jgi:hypothetical protein
MLTESASPGIGADAVAGRSFWALIQSPIPGESRAPSGGTGPAPWVPSQVAAAPTARREKARSGERGMCEGGLRNGASGGLR